jgi:SAM-dependent methyltransferase
VEQTDAQRGHSYVLDGTDSDLRRLLSIAEVAAVAARRKLEAIGVGPGWRVLDCGCGPLGALAVLSELVGPTGRVVGLDMNASTVDRALSVVSVLGLDNVEVFVGDVHDAEVSGLDPPFDLAYTRCFLMHQADPVMTLSKIAALVRPGGWVMAQEPLRDPPPCSYPPSEALRAYWETMYAAVEHFGALPDAVPRLARAAASAGLDVVEVDGHFGVNPAAVGFEIHAATATAVKDRALQSGVISEQEIDKLIAELSQAGAVGYEWVTSPYFMDLTLRKPG